MKPPAERPAHKSASLCSTPFCRHTRRRQRWYCNKCRKRKWREANPVEYLYDNLRTHAKQRGKRFELTLEQWRKFCLETSYHMLKGQEPHSATVDRRDSAGPYSIDNIFVNTHQANSHRQDRPWEPNDNPF